MILAGSRYHGSSIFEIHRHGHGAAMRWDVFASTTRFYDLHSGSQIQKVTHTSIICLHSTGIITLLNITIDWLDPILTT